MPTFLSDPPPALYLVLAAAVFITGGVWFNSRTRRAAAALGTVALSLALLFLIDRLVESPREEAVRRAQAMVQAADARDPEAFLSHVADQVEYRGETAAVTVTREQLRNSQIWGLLKQYNAHVAAWDFSRSDVAQPDDKSIEIGFLAKGEAGGKQVPMYFRARFARQPDGQMKLVGLESFDPLKRVNERKSIPFFP
ncbi:MAG TPA: hypothetical protein VM529_06315 [Gemmata sp.]|nr:hypothetical protein [Gemmata sp.]